MLLIIFRSIPFLKAVEVAACLTLRAVNSLSMPHWYKTDLVQRLRNCEPTAL